MADIYVFLLRKFIQRILKLLAKIYLARTKPHIIVIAGTTNRHWIKESIADSLDDKGIRYRVNKKNFNAEIGLPLSVLGLSSDAGSENAFKRWVKILRQGIQEAIMGKPLDYLVLETAIDKPRDMRYLLSIIKPNSAIFTSITMIYPENFENLDQIAKEYKKLIKALPDNGLAVLNADDERILKLRDFAGCKVITYGIENKNADYLADEIQKTDTGQNFKLHMPDLSVEAIKINRFGLHHVYAQLIQKIINEQLA